MICETKLRISHSASKQSRGSLLNTLWTDVEASVTRRTLQNIIPHSMLKSANISPRSITVLLLTAPGIMLLVKGYSFESLSEAGISGNDRRL
ncbi:hypothetical protein TNIN_403761 [Trichonephila inaurata madagascariensis]|uniref:Uncharacterized protein n=1 Tax=Trichonephila inaurata madagascariensis TaxID=2747483 RepID=A0A8X7BRI4_9ARAC|nr:hypothetical protein TNIN_403761 [Trichonephila inaurata madagascariensis]